VASSLGHTKGRTHCQRGSLRGLPTVPGTKTCIEFGFAQDLFSESSACGIPETPPWTPPPGPPHPNADSLRQTKAVVSRKCQQFPSCRTASWVSLAIRFQPSRPLGTESKTIGLPILSRIFRGRGQRAFGGNASNAPLR
jgi:hypothetical protein